MSSSAISVPIAHSTCAASSVPGTSFPVLQREHQLLGEGDRQAEQADRHRQLRDPQRRGVDVLRHVVVHIRAPHQLRGEPCEVGGEQRGHHQAQDFHPVPGAALQARQDQRDPDVVAAAQRVRHGEERSRGEAVPGVGVETRHRESELASGNPDHLDHERREDEQRAESAERRVERIEDGTPHGEQAKRPPCGGLVRSTTCGTRR
jgi:hypothetical protein